ncbi:MAG: TIGR03943 family protein [Spirochaetales bacterium]|nr:TIGR03943 family protein [Spirochaetales bacterium]
MEIKSQLKKVLPPLLYALMLGAYGKLFLTGEIFLYLRPRYAYLSLLVMVFLVILIVYSSYLIIKKPQEEGDFKFSYLILCLPFLVALLHTPEMYSEQTIQRKKKLYDLQTAPLIAEEPGESVENGIENQLITLDREHFYYYLHEIYIDENYQKYLHKPVIIRGIYFQDDEYFRENQAFVGRFIMYCCAADAVMDGLYLEFEGDHPPVETGEWLEAEGTLEYGETLTEGEMPLVRVKEWRQIDREPSNYVFPTFPEYMEPEN